MSGTYQIFGAEMSPYSVKVRSYFRYKNIPHQWLQRSQHEDAYKKVAKLPIIPAVATPDGQGMQDSTPIMDALDVQFPDPSIHPDDPALAFLSVLIEEYGDEWGNKLMFHHRWWDDADQIASAHVLARAFAPMGDDETIHNIAKMVRERMGSRGHFVGSSAETAPLIRGYLIRLLDILEAHLESRPYLFGARPAYGDFGLAAQLYECALDPTAGGIMRARYINVLDWCYRMIEPRNDGPFETWESLKPTLMPLLENAGSHFLPWSAANAAALEKGAESFSVDLGGQTYTQGPQKYHAKSLKVLREKYAAVAERSRLDPILEATGCLTYLRS